jgi:lambda repressor-like predicted transcriptional regulator
MPRRIDRGGRDPRRFRPKTLAQLTTALTHMVAYGATVASASRIAQMHDMTLRTVLWELRGDWTSHPTLRDAVCVGCVQTGWSVAHTARVTGVSSSTIQRAVRRAQAAA